MEVAMVDVLAAMGLALVLVKELVQEHVLVIVAAVALHAEEHVEALFVI